MKSNREQIVKALECCIVQHTECRKCPLLYTACESGACYKQAKVDALALIKELTEENSNLDDTIACLKIELETIKSDTVRKMQEKIRARSEYGTINISPWQFDQIAKEVLEENNGIH